MKKIKIILSVFVLFIGSACTDLDETLYDRLGAGNFFQNEEEIKAGLANVYYRLMASHNWLFAWQLQEVTTDHGEVPTRNNGGWYDGGKYITATTHTWDATQETVNNVYGGLYWTIAATNSFIETIQVAQKDINGLEPIEAEVRAIRAWSYYELCDYYGNVPLVTVSKLDQQNLPTNSTRLAVFNFIEDELLAAAEVLPSVNDVSRSDYYPRISKETVWAMLARLYLNAKVYSGTARWKDCIDICDKIISSEAFQLTPSIWDSFVPENEDSPEIIFGISYSNKDITNGSTGSNYINQLGLHPLLQQKYDLPFTPWGGPRVGGDHYKIYDDADFRKSLILSGKQYSSSGEFLFEILPLEHMNNAHPDEGLISVKYVPDPEQIGVSGRNDLVMIRYAEILLNKAEAILRSGGSESDAVALVNKVRERNFTPYVPLTSITLDEILEERSREFLWECNYRTDLIRYDKFLSNTYNFKPDPTTESFRTIFPIPQSELESNPNLVQNPGY